MKQTEEYFKEIYGRTVEEAQTSYNGHDMVRFAKAFTASLQAQPQEQQGEEFPGYGFPLVTKDDIKRKATIVLHKHCPNGLDFEAILDAMVEFSTPTPPAPLPDKVEYDCDTCKFHPCSSDHKVLKDQCGDYKE